MNVTIIGGGITGISIARMLQKRGVEFRILEKELEPGGLCRSIKYRGHNLDIGGGHFLYSKHKEFYDFIFEHIPENNFNKYDRISKINLGGNIIDYPIEININQLPFDIFFEYLDSIFTSGNRMGISAPQKYVDWIKWKLGEKIADNYMIPYNQKVWGKYFNEMDTKWLHKIPNIELKDIVKNLLNPTLRKDFYPHYYYYYPKEGGFQVIFDSILKKVESHLITNYSITSIENINNKWLINKEIESDIVINTAPWESFNGILTDDVFVQSVETLKHNSIMVSLYNGDYTNNYHWLYDPDLNKTQHRSFFIKNFSPLSKKGGMSDETNIERFNNDEKYIYSHLNKFAYPVPVSGERIKDILDFYDAKKFYGLGRWGQWQYFNSDACIIECIKLMDRINKYI